MIMNLHELAKKFDITFDDETLLIQAFTHSSYVNEHRKGRYLDNERLEFLGDAVLELGISQYLYKENIAMPEGEMTKRRASIVCEESLYHFAQELQFGDYILLGKDRKSTRLNSSHVAISYAVFCLKK